MPKVSRGLHDLAVRAGAPPLDLVAIGVRLGCVVDDEEKVAARIAPPVGDKRIMRLPVLVDVNDSIPILAFSLHDASAFCGFGAAQRIPYRRDRTNALVCDLNGHLTLRSVRRRRRTYRDYRPCRCICNDCERIRPGSGHSLVDTSYCMPRRPGTNSKSCV